MEPYCHLPPLPPEPVVKVFLHRDELPDGLLVEPEVFRHRARDERPDLREVLVGEDLRLSRSRAVVLHSGLLPDQPSQGSRDAIVSGEVWPVRVVLDPDRLLVRPLDVEAQVREPVENPFLREAREPLESLKEYFEDRQSLVSPSAIRGRCCKAP